MKSISMVLLSLCLASITAFGQEVSPLEGIWQGALVRENSVQLIKVRFTGAGNDLTGQYAVPELGLYEQPVREMSATDSTVNFRILYGPFALRFHTDIDQLTGINERWKPPVSLHLKRVSDLFREEYEAEELTFFNGQVSLAATLIKPAGQGPFPGVVVVHGSGDQSRKDWEYRSHGYSLARRGVAVLLYDKRGVGQSTGDYKTVSFDELADDAVAGLSVLRSRDDIDHSAIGLLGVSQGGWISAIASRKAGKPDFVVMLQGPAVSLEEQELHRVKYTMLTDGYAPESIDSAIALSQLYFQFVNELTGWDELLASSASAVNSTWGELVNTTSSQDDPDLAWWRNNAYDPADDLKSIGVPVLSIFGEIDTAVPVRENRPKMRKYLTEAGVAFEIAVIPDMYHSVTTYQGLYGGDMWKWPDVFWNWSRRPPSLDDTIVAWLLRQSQ